MIKYFAGYVTLRGITSVTDTQAKKLTHLNLAFAPMKDGETFMELNDRQLHEIARIRRANPKLAILVSTGGGGDRGPVGSPAGWASALGAPGGESESGWG